MASRIKLKTISEKANVSISTVSRVITNKGYVSPEARERVLNVLGELTDKKIRTAEEYKAKKLSVAIVLSQDEFIDEDPDTSVDVSTIRKTIESDGHSVEVLHRAVQREKDPRLSDESLDSCDVVILYDPSVRDPVLDTLRLRDIPYILTNGVAPDTNFFVDYDNFRGAESAMTHLLDLGHRSIGFISGFPDRYVSVNRLEACKSAMFARGLAWDDSFVEPGFFKLNGGYTACETLLARHPEITAIFALNDLSAIGAMRALKEMGKRIPDDISIVGFDDMEIANYSDPPLTTVSRFSSEYNAMLSQAVNDIGKYDSLSHIGILLKTELVIRKSTAPLQTN